METVLTGVNDAVSPKCSASSVMPHVLMKDGLQDLRPLSRGLVMAQRLPSTADSTSFLDKTRETRHRALRSAPGERSGTEILKPNHQWCC